MEGAAVRWARQEARRGHGRWRGPDVGLSRMGAGATERPVDSERGRLDEQRGAAVASRYRSGPEAASGKRSRVCEKAGLGDYCPDCSWGRLAGRGCGEVRSVLSREDRNPAIASGVKRIC